MVALLASGSHCWRRKEARLTEAVQLEAPSPGEERLDAGASPSLMHALATH